MSIIQTFTQFLRLMLLGAWLLVLCIFEDTEQWTHERLILLRRSFAVVMIVLLTVSAMFTFKALAEATSVTSESHTIDRLRRVETRQDQNFDEHRIQSDRIANLEAQMRTIDRLIYGVAGLTFAVLGQWLLMLFKFKVDLEKRNEFEPKRHEPIS